MTDKKESILRAALELFANDGYNVTSTSKIAKKAGVSEGLIFRHFENKKGLLDAIVADAQQRLSEVFAHILFEDDPKEVIRKTIVLPFEMSKVDKVEVDFWKLQFILKWQAEYNNPHKMKPIIDKLAWAFEKLGYAAPENEAALLNQIIDAISISILRDDIKPHEQYKLFLLEKYKV
jgi:AcrR family transcriptional regulator